jgi:PEGA domain
MNRPRFALALALALAIPCAGPRASAQPLAPTPGARNADDVKRARESFLLGDKLYTDQKWTEAEAAFLTAWSLNPTFDVASNLGNTQFKLGKFRDAAEHLAFALRHWPLIGPVARRQHAQEKLRAAKSHVGTITVKVNVEHAAVSVDGKAIGKAPLDLEIFVEPGRHAIEARLEEHDPVSQAVELAAGASTNVSLSLAKTVVPAPVVKGQETDAGTKKDVPPEPVPVPLPPPVPETRYAPPPRSLVPGFVVGGVGVAALATGVGLFVAGVSKGSSAQSHYDAILKAGNSCVPAAGNFDPSCAQLSGISSTGDTLHNAGVGLMIGGSAAVAAGIVYVVWPQARGATPQAGSVSIAPMASATHAGLIFSSTF